MGLTDIRLRVFFAPKICSFSLHTYSRNMNVFTYPGLSRSVFFKVASIMVVAWNFTLTENHRWPTTSIMTLKYNSQEKKGCQVSNAFRNGAHQQVAMKISAPKYTYSRWVRCQIRSLPHQVCIAFWYSFFICPFFMHLGQAAQYKSFQGSQWLN